MTLFSVSQTRPLPLAGDRCSEPGRRRDPPPGAPRFRWANPAIDAKTPFRPGASVPTLPEGAPGRFPLPAIKWK
jgi:hypothetical protein